MCCYRSTLTSFVRLGSWIKLKRLALVAH
uniref:Uncharacterized protein n=1 Tax=Anguilla anguilla TaxID=7936 RepID=A0A0E9UI99_ANGAN